jgi:ABC-type proline/glycine betaine transport system ATPase subunit
MTEENKNTVTYAEKEYNVDELSARGQVLVGFVRTVREEAAGLQSRLAVLQAAEITFSKELEEILNAPEQETLENMD